MVAMLVVVVVVVEEALVHGEEFVAVEFAEVAKVHLLNLQTVYVV